MAHEDIHSFETLASFDNLLWAFKKAAKGKRGKHSVSRFEFGLEDELMLLRSELLDGEYLSGSYMNFYIHEPKRRLISAAPFRDRVVHHALCNIIEPPFERSFIYDSYANRINKGTHKARARAQHFARTYPYVLPLDVKQFFPSINHGILERELFKRVTDNKIQSLISQILHSGKGVHSTSLSDLIPKGLPIGNLTSQFWANVYMNPVDHFVKRTLQCKGYVRYVDDFLLFANSKQQLHNWHGKVKQFIETKLLTLHEGSHPKPVTEGVSFLGFVIFPESIRLKRRKGIHFQRKIKRLVASETDREQVLASAQGWMNHTRYGNTTGLQKKLLRLPGGINLYDAIVNRPTKKNPVSLQLYVYTNRNDQQYRP